MLFNTMTMFIHLKKLRRSLIEIIKNYESKIELKLYYTHSINTDYCKSFRQYTFLILFILN